MKRLPSIWLLIMSVIWFWHAGFHGLPAKNRALSHALQMQNDLDCWASQYVTAEERAEIFNEDNMLRLGGEHPSWTFPEMIVHIATDAVPPLWPAVVGFVLGGYGIWSSGKPLRTNSAEDDGESQGGYRDS